MIARIIFSAALLIFAAGMLRAETREYMIMVDGKEAGQSTITIADSPDGKSYMKATASVKVAGVLGLIGNYSFQSDVQEWYEKDRLTNLVAVTTENGKKTEVSAKAEVDRMLVSVNGETRAMSWEAWSSSFWKLADRRFHNKTVPVLEPDSGKDATCKLEYIGNEKIKVGSQSEDCFHFRVTGLASPTDLWFDRHHRMVRQEFTEGTHKTIVQLMTRK